MAQSVLSEYMVDVEGVEVECDLGLVLSNCDEASSSSFTMVRAPSETEHRLIDLDFLSNCKGKILASTNSFFLVHIQNSKVEEDTLSKLVVCNPMTK